MSTNPSVFCEFSLFFQGKTHQPECTAVAATRLRMQMRIPTRHENSLANFGQQVSNKKLRIKRCESIALAIAKTDAVDGVDRGEALANFERDDHTVPKSVSKTAKKCE